MKASLIVTFNAFAHKGEDFIESKEMKDKTSFKKFLENVPDEVDQVDFVMDAFSLHGGSDMETLLTLHRVRLKGGKTAWRP